MITVAGEPHAAVRIRRAVPGDGAALSTLYAEAYRTPGPAGTVRRYPFPQFFDAAWLDAALAGGGWRWLLAEADDEVTGAVAAADVGDRADGVVEMLGLVVAASWRHQGVAGDVFGLLDDVAGEGAELLLGQARTAHPWACRVARRWGCVPLGFEPCAHVTPAGVEPMLVLGRVSQPLLRARRCAAASRAVAGLARVVGAELGFAPPLAVDAEPYEVVESAVEIVESSDHADLAGDSDVATLKRPEGTDGSGRFRRIDVVARRGRCAPGRAHVTLDLVDRRARIVGLQAAAGTEGTVLAAVLCALDRRVAAGEVIATVVDIRADAPRLHATLERMRWFPTAYVPGVLVTPVGRRDVVQYARLTGVDPAAAAARVADCRWAVARQVMDVVVALGRRLG